MRSRRRRAPCSTPWRARSASNWDLSAKRATAVLDYLFTSDPTLSDAYGSYFAASAYSKFRPFDSAKSEAAYRQNRRIEISVVPKDANIRHVIDDYMTRTQQP
jgi:chemotaxis protein MotB